MTAEPTYTGPTATADDWHLPPGSWVAESPLTGAEPPRRRPLCNLRDAPAPASDSVAVVMLPDQAAEMDPTAVLRRWLRDLGEPPSRITSVAMQGAWIAFSSRSVVVVSTTDQFDDVVRAVVLACSNELALDDLERTIESSWPAYERLTEVAFDGEGDGRATRNDASTFCSNTFQLRRSLIQLLPRITMPPRTPPTLASQIDERLRERLRQHERLDLVEEAIAAHERLGTELGQRLSDRSLATRGHHLEWAILVLLAMQTLMWVIETLSAAGEG